MTRSFVVLRRLVVLVLALATASVSSAQAQQQRVLVFSKTAGFRHSSIETGVALVKKIGAQQGFAVDATEDATAFTDANLRKYRAVVFMSTTGDVLNDVQQDALERYIQAGGGWVGVHSATDTEYDWPWYGKLAGAWFSSHPLDPNVRTATFRVLDKNHVSTTGFPDSFKHEDEFYNYKYINPDIHVLVDIDEKSYQGGTNGDHHPMSWYHEYDGGRAWYTNMGHTEATYAEPFYIKHLTGGIKWAMGTKPLNYSLARPEENRFTKVVLAEGLDEPVELAVLPRERILFIQRKGEVDLYSPATKSIRKLGTIPVSLKYTDGSTAEDGLIGLTIDPSFAKNGWVYMYYSAVDRSSNVLARFHMKGDSIDLASPKVMLEVPTQREQCCHTAGSMTFDAHGNLFLSTGDNTNPHATGYAPIDERAGRGPWDAQKSSANTNDLRGKILRIHPEPDGSYTIPEGNLFSKGTPKTRPEIYTMGHRNPYRISVDKHTGFLYWGDVGPDASVDSAQRGPMGHDEVNQARKAGNFGWPYFVGDNKAYFDYDFATNTPGKQFDPAHPVNDSPNNTGLNDLPPAQKAFVWYPAGKSAEFPLVGSGGRTAMAGPVFHREDFKGAPSAFPAYYDGKLLEYEWMRGWIMAVTMDKNGDFASMERFMPSQKFSNPIELEFAPSGNLYMLEYGTGWFQGNPDARLVRIEYNGGNRTPVVVAEVDRDAGPLPMKVALSSKGTNDPDGDALRYQWTITGTKGAVVTTTSDANPSYTFTKPGVYTAALAVTDAKGARSTSSVQIVAGNEPPVVDVDVAGNKSFYFAGTPIRYAVKVTDREDGSLESGKISADRVTVSAEYLKDGAPAEPAAGHRSPGPADPHAEGKKLVGGSDCLACHQVERKSIGPAYNAVAEKYRGDASALTKLVTKVKSGGSGVWGDVMMPPHPQLTDVEATRMVAYVLSLGAKKGGGPSLPAKGEYTPPAPAAGAAPGAVLLRASYTDQGANGLPGATAEKSVVLRSPTIVLATGDVSEGVSKMQVPQMPVTMTMPSKSGSWARLKQIDLTGISEVVIAATAPAQYAVGGKVEVRADSATGPLLGETEMLQKQESLNTPPAQLKAALKATTGAHDVYFVFRNEEAKPQQMILIALTVTFVNGSGAPQAATGRQ
ncbi:MAG TPA: ThuA domain-containing protein [Gemmatimonadaceae bacterium]|jgi:cytochrome c|nr:ThuA domain-containing protein [Gemmatimonadaceae bacterium]